MDKRQRKSNPAGPRENRTDDRRQIQGGPTSPLLGDGLEGRDASRATGNTSRHGSQAEVAVKAFGNGRAGEESCIMGWGGGCEKEEK